MSTFAICNGRFSSPLTKSGSSDSLRLGRFGRVIGDGVGRSEGVQDDLIATWAEMLCFSTQVGPPTKPRLTL